MILTTTTHIEGRSIREYRGLVTAERLIPCSQTLVLQQLPEIRHALLQQLQTSAGRLGAQAVVGIQFSYTYISHPADAPYLLATMYGTAVLLG